MNIKARINMMIAFAVLFSLFCFALNYSWEQVEVMKKPISVERVKR